MKKTRILVDTNVILAAFKIKCWTAICKAFSVETVQKCIEEVETGNPNDPHRIRVDKTVLIKGLAASHETSKREILNLYTIDPDSQGLDPGELHLFAWLKVQQTIPGNLILISTADKAALVASSRLGWLDSLISLEELAQQAGVLRSQINALGQQFSARWLAQIRTDIRLGII